MADLGNQAAERDMAEGRTKMLRGEVLDESGKPLTLDTIAKWENDQGFFTGKSGHFIKGVKSVMLENKAMEFDSHMQKFVTEGPLLNVKDPAERARMIQEEATRYRQAVMDQLGPEYKNDFPLIDKYFNSFQMRTQDRMVGHLAAQQAKIHVDEAKQAFKERTYATLQTVTSHPDFLGAGPEQRAEMLAKHLGGSRILFESMGMAGPEVDEMLLSEVTNFMEALDIGPNDYRADALIGALRRIPTATGFLGQTAEMDVRLRQLQDKADARVDRVEAREERRITLQEKQELRGVQQGIAAFLESDPGATFDDLLESGAKIANSRFARDYFKKYQGFISDTQDRAETSSMLDLEEELTIGLIRGTHTMDDVLDAKDRLSRRQREGLIKKAEHMLTSRDQVVKMVGASRFNEVQKAIEDGQKDALRTGQSDQAPSLETQILAGKKAVVAKNMFEAALYREIGRLLEEGASVEDIQKMLPDTLERLSAPLMDPNNKQVTKRANEYLKGVNLSPLNPLLDDFNLSYSGGQSPKPSIVPPRVGQFADLASQETGVPLASILAVAYAESRYDEQAKNPASTAYGTMQILEGTATELGINPADPRENILGGAKYLAMIARKHGLNLSQPEHLALAYCYYHDGPNHRGPFSSYARAGAARVRASLGATAQVQDNLAQARVQQQQEAERQKRIETEAAQTEAARIQAEEAPYYSHLGPLSLSLDGMADLTRALNSKEASPVLDAIRAAVPDADMAVVERILAKMWNERVASSSPEEVARAMQRLAASQEPVELRLSAEDLLEPFM